ncbi:MAG TPA: ModD protein [Anaeromyxobacteraceae bacterium]|nr:ModD protein [Anaeromyxobacteraceae bacterium]
MISDEALDALLLEDAPHGDRTTEALGIGALRGRISFTVREPLVVAGVEEAARVLARAGAAAHVRTPDGAWTRPGDVLLDAEGSAAALHLGWKVALHLLEHLSGIATRTRRMLKAAREGAGGRHVPVAATRKCFPGTRDLALLAVRAGGGVPHRLGLSASVLVFRQHTAFLPGGLPAAVDLIRRHDPGRKVVVEASTLEEAIAATRAGADVIQAEKFPPGDFAAVVEACRRLSASVRVAATGGVEESNAAAYARAGADFLVTSAPFAARPAEIQVSIGPA